MPQRFYTKVGDTGRPLVVTLTGSDGSVQDLSGASAVVLNARFTRTDVRKINGGACAVVAPATDGRVRYDPDPADVDTPGVLQCEFVATLAGNEQVTFPSGPEPDQYLEWVVQAEI